eukprot:6199350-Pleurochrysis_carterae.AAC.2
MLFCFILDCAPRVYTRSRDRAASASGHVSAARLATLCSERYRTRDELRELDFMVPRLQVASSPPPTDPSTRHGRILGHDEETGRGSSRGSMRRGGRVRPRHLTPNLPGEGRVSAQKWAARDLGAGNEHMASVSRFHSHFRVPLRVSNEFTRYTKGQHVAYSKHMISPNSVNHEHYSLHTSTTIYQILRRCMYLTQVSDRPESCKFTSFILHASITALCGTTSQVSGTGMVVIAVSGRIHPLGCGAAHRCTN